MATRKTTKKTRSGSGTGEKKPTPTTGAETTARPTAAMTTAPTKTPTTTTPPTKTPTTTTTQTATPTATAAAPTASPTRLSSTALAGAIEVGSLPKLNIIVRDGVEVASPAMNLTRVEAFVERLQPIIAFNTPRVVQQSVKPGTRVAKGTVVDLVLVPPTNIELGLLDRPHLSFQHRTVQQVAPIVTTARPILEKRATAAELNDNERAQMFSILTEYGIEMNDESPDYSLDAAYRMLQGAKAYS